MLRHTKITESYKPVSNTITRLTNGILYDRFSLNINNLFNRIDVDTLCQIFSETHDSWYAEPEFTGKYLDTAMQLYHTTGDARALEKARMLKNAIVHHQRSDGYLGTYMAGKEFDDTFSVWNQNFVIMGLLSFHEETGDPDALNAAMKCADFIATNYMKPDGPDILMGANQGIENFCIINQMPRLYKYTGKELYLKFCHYLVEKMESSNLRLVSIPIKTIIPTVYLGSAKAIELLVCYHGLIELYKVTGDETFLESCTKYWDFLNGAHIGITGCGSIAEMWTMLYNKALSVSSDFNPNENCVAAGWIKFSYYLYELTGEAKYFDAIEKSLFNHILGSQAIDGSDFSYYQGLIGQKLHKKEAAQYSCCRYRGMNIMAHLPRYIFTQNDAAVYVNLYTSSKTEVLINGTSVQLVQETNFPKSGNSTIVVNPSKSALFKICLRVPAWCHQWKVLVNGTEDPATMTNRYLEIERTWNNNDTIELTLAMSTLLFRTMVEGKDSTAVIHGPIVLALDSRYGTPIDDCAITLANNEITLDNRTDGVMAPIMRFETNGRYRGENRRITLVDYASAGSIDPTTDRFKVWIPVKEV